MITAQKFVEIFAKDQPKKIIKFAKVDSSYTTGHPRLVFDGESLASAKQYPYLASYTPIANDRVMVLSGVVIGKIM